MMPGCIVCGKQIKEPSPAGHGLCVCSQECADVVIESYGI